MRAVRDTVIESVTQSEVSQKEESKYHILMHMYVIWKNGTTEPICRAGIEMQRTSRNSGGSNGWDELR